MSDSEDEQFAFQSVIDFDARQEEKENLDSNDHNFKTLSEICNSFYDDLQKNDFFQHKTSWRTSTSIDPIKLKISSQETLPGICDIIKPSKNFYTKVLTALGTIILEVDNLLPNIGTTNYESLYPLSVYGEEIDDGKNEDKAVNDEEIRISRMLPVFHEIFDKINKLMNVAINLLNQLASLYSEQNAHYTVSYKFYNFGLAFDYLAKILSYFLAIDNVVSGNDYLRPHWNKYRSFVYQLKNNLSEFNMTEEQRKKLDKFVKKVNAPIFENTCYIQCIHIIKEKSGQISPSGQGIKPLNQCKLFLQHFNLYMNSRIKKINSNMDKLTETYEANDLFQYLSLLGFYIKLFGKDSDKSILKLAWLSQKKIANINIVGISYFNIKNFLEKFDEFKRGVSLDPPNVDKQIKANLTSLEKQLPFIINNYSKNLISWATKMDSIFSNSKDFAPKFQGNPKLLETTSNKIKLIIEGLCTANYLRKNVSFILDSHFSLGIQLNKELINQLTIGIELIKVVEFEFSKLMNLICLNIPIFNRALLFPIQDILKKVAEKAQKKYKDGKSTNEQLYKDALSASSIFYTCTQSVQSELRLVIEKLCFSTITAKEMLDDNSYDTINENLWTIEILNQLTREITRCCDCSFLYLYQTIFQNAFENIYNDRPKRIYYFIMAVNDIENPLHYIKFKENDGIDDIKRLRKVTIETFEKFFMKQLSEQLEKDLQIQVHSTFIEGLDGAEYSETNLQSYLNIQPFRFFDIVFDVKRYMEEHLNKKFYQMTTLNLNNYQTYQRMRVLARNKYGLNLHEVYLPNQNLVTGKDILEVVRNLTSFAKGYTHNLHSQQFIEIVKDGSYINIIGVQQILTSLYTHGKGIINTIINTAFGYISKNVGTIIDIIRDDYIISMLREEHKFWEEQKANINYNYPLERGQNLRQKIIAYNDNKKNGIIPKCIRIITQIGNVVSLIRCIRTALMDYNSQNVNLLTTYNTNEFSNLIDRISLSPDSDPSSKSSQISQNMITNTQNSLIDSSKLFCKTISALKQTGENEINYLLLLVSAFSESINTEKIPYIDLFAFLLPPLIITFIDTAINAKDNLLKKNKSEECSYFSDDGFIMGMCYLLKLFMADKKFESLNWFPSVIQFYNNKKGDKKTDKYTGGIDTLNEREISSYKEQFELQYYTYTSASLLFTD
jgi:WASH complex subunit 7